MKALSRRTWLKTLAAGTALAPFLDFAAPSPAQSTVNCPVASQTHAWFS